MGDGWIKLHRALEEHPVWTGSNSIQRNILITILLMANHKPNKWLWKGEKFEVQAGQMITSLESITKKCGNDVSIRNVRTALKHFEKLDFLTSKSTNKGRLISIINWDTYQGSNNQDDKQSDKQVTSNRQASDKQVTTIKECKKERKKETNTPKPPTGDFDRFWKEYPKKMGKGKAEEALNKIRPSQKLMDEIMEAIERQKKSDQWTKEEGKYIPNPATWLNQKRWGDELETCSEQLEKLDWDDL
jgi:DNA replication protein DnaD